MSEIVSVNNDLGHQISQVIESPVVHVRLPVWVTAARAGVV